MVGSPYPFGAEPPQPDADMLHRIAENTVQSRVAAEVSDNSVVLRQDGRPTSTLAAPLAASAAQPAPEPVAQPAPMPAAEPVVEPASAAPFAGDSIAAKLQRIRSVVAQEAEITEQTAPFYSEDEHADAVPVKAASAPVDLSVTEETPDEQADVENAEATADSVEADSTAEDAADEVTDTELEVAEDTTTDANESDDSDDTVIADALEALEADDDPVAVEDEAEVAENIFEAEVPRSRILVQKVSREEVEAAQQGDEVVSDEAELSEEAEAALLRELSDVEADIDDATTEETTAEDTSEAVQDDVAPDAAEDTLVADAVEEAEIASDDDDSAKEEARAERKARRSRMLESEDAALNRLMDATRTRMSDDDEGAVRRASIAHLKAAVAATKADDSIAEAAAKEEERELDQYRDDLARVVRPVRSRAIEGEEGEARPSTLMLVSEQRIEKDKSDAPAAPEADVRPRRVATAGNLALEEQFEDVDANAQPAGDTETFTEFAQRVKALELPDLLEAAAAHYSYVEKTKEFTRPMLMRKISTLESGTIPSREEGLRCFGALLRDNKIIRSGNGKFVLSDTTRFASEARNEAG